MLGRATPHGRAMSLGCQSMDTCSTTSQHIRRLPALSSQCKHSNVGVSFFSESNLMRGASLRLYLQRKQRRTDLSVVILLKGSGYRVYGMTHNIPRLRETGISAISGFADLETNVVLNETAPLVGGVFESSSSQKTELDGGRGGNFLEDGAAFLRNRLERKAAVFKQAVVSIEEAIAPTPLSPAQGDDAAGFVVISLFLIAAFWIGNYAAPKWIFSSTVFRNVQARNGYNSGLPIQEDDTEYSDSDFSGISMKEKTPPKEREDEIDPADLIELPKNFKPLERMAIAAYKEGRQKARDAEEGRQEERRRKRNAKGKRG